MLLGPSYIVRCFLSTPCAQILAKGGVFVCRVYELLTRFSAGLLYLLYHLFDEVAIIKPALTSDLSSSERFLVCRGFQGCRSSIIEVGGGANHECIQDYLIDLELMKLYSCNFLRRE